MQITQFAHRVKHEVRTTGRLTACSRMNYFECMSSLRILGRPGQRRALAPCRPTPHPAYVDTQNTQKKRRMEALGAQLAKLRTDQNMPRQDQLATASGVGVRTISDIETGKKIPRVTTMRKIEAALNLPEGATDDFMDYAIDKLVPKSAGPDLYPAEVYEREPRGEVEHEMLAIRGETDDVKWSYIIDRRKRLYDEKRRDVRRG